MWYILVNRRLCRSSILLNKDLPFSEISGEMESLYRDCLRRATCQPQRCFLGTLKTEEFWARGVCVKFEEPQVGKMTAFVENLPDHGSQVGDNEAGRRERWRTVKWPKKRSSGRRRNVRYTLSTLGQARQCASNQFVERELLKVASLLNFLNKPNSTQKRLGKCNIPSE